MKTLILTFFALFSFTTLAASVCIVTVVPNSSSAMSCNGDAATQNNSIKQDNGSGFLQNLTGKGYKILNVSATKEAVVYTLTN